MWTFKTTKILKALQDPKHRFGGNPREMGVRRGNRKQHHHNKNSRRFLISRAMHGDAKRWSEGWCVVGLLCLLACIKLFLNLQLSTPHSPSKLIMSEFEKQNADASDSDSDEEEIPDVRLVNTKCFIEFHSHATT